MMIDGDLRVQSSSSTPPPPPPGTVAHTVKSGETVGELATHYGVSEKQILAANPQLRHPDELSVGQEILIPVMDHQDSPIGPITSANPFQHQISAVDAAARQYQSAHNGPQRQSASATITHAVEQELSARATTAMPPEQSPTDSLISSYGTAIASRYANNPGITRAIQQGESNEDAAVRTNDAVKQVQSAQHALQVAGTRASASVKNQLNQSLTTAQGHLLSQVEQEIQTRSGLAPGQLPSAAQVQKYEATIAQRYASDPSAAKAVSTALQTAPADIQARQIAAQAKSAGDPNKELTALNQAYVKAAPQVQQRIMAQSDTQAILESAAAQQTHPLSQLKSNSGDFWSQTAGLEQSLRNLDQAAGKLDPTLAAGLVNQALPALNHFNSQYAQEYGGSGIESDPLHIGAASVATVMDISGHIAGTTQGDQDVAQLAKLGFWNNNEVSNALYGGASAAYPEAVARLATAKGEDPTNIISIIQQGVQNDQQRVQSDVKALGQNNAELSWLVQNIGPSMTQQQLQSAIGKYESQNGWSAKNQQLTQKVVADATTLTQNMKSLSALAQANPKVASELDVQGTISSALNDPVTGYGLTLAAGQNPGLYADSKGQSFLNLVSGLKLADQGRKTTQLIGSLYVRSMITRSLNSVNWNGSDPLAEAQQVINTLKSPTLSNWMGVNDNTVWNSAVKIVSQNLAEPGDSQAIMDQKLGNMDQALNKLKALSASTPAGQMLRSVAVAYAFTNTVNSAQKFAAAEGAPDKTITGLETLSAAAGLLQKGANLANGFGLLKPGSLMSSFAKDTANGTISIFSGALDLTEGIRSLGGFGEQQDIPDGVFSTMSGVGGIAYGASQFAETGIFDGFSDAAFGVTGGTFAAGLGLAGVGIVAASVLGSAIYKQAVADHQYEGSSKSFLEAGGFSPSAASALSHEGGLLSGAGGTSGMPFLAKYAEMEHLSTAQLQKWVNSLTPSQLSTLDQCLLQTAGDSNGNPANFTNGPEQKAVIPDYSGGFPAIVPLTNTLGVFQSNLKAGGVPLPP